MNAELLRHAWPLLFLGPVLHAIRITRWSQPYIAEKPERASGYASIVRHLLITGNVPWLVMGVLIESRLVPGIFEFFNIRSGNLAVVVWYVIVAAMLLRVYVWLFFQAGAAFLADHPGTLTRSEISVTQVKLFAFAAIACNIAFFVMVVAMKVPRFAGLVTRTPPMVISLVPATAATSVPSYHTVFDVSTSGTDNLGFALFPLIFVAAGVALCLVPDLFGRPSPRWFRFVFLGFAILMSLIMIPAVLFADMGLRTALRNSRCTMVQGRVTNFHPMPYGGHDKEAFDVAGSTLSIPTSRSPPASATPPATAARSAKDYPSESRTSETTSHGWRSQSEGDHQRRRRGVIHSVSSTAATTVYVTDVPGAKL